MKRCTSMLQYCTPPSLRSKASPIKLAEGVKKMRLEDDRGWEYPFSMQLKSLSARYDGSRVLFDDDVNIPPQTRLLVTILDGEDDPERAEFLALSAGRFADAFDGDEVEYSEADLRQ